MRVELSNISNLNNMAFSGARARKLIEKIKNMKKLEKADVSFDELKSMYNEIGYDVVYKRGSHAVVPITEDFNIPVVIPHKRKNVHPFDLKRFKYILTGEFDKAKDCR